MADQPLTGPLATLQLQDGTLVPFYVVPFDDNGTCSGPRTADDAVAAAGSATDVFLFSHGWNNDWAAATGGYYDFLREYSAMRAQQWEPSTRPYRPLLVGVFWPSTALVAPWEEGPEIAADPLMTPEQLVDALADAAAERAGLEAVAARIPAASRDRFYALVQNRDGLSEAAADELTALVAPVLAGDPDELDDPGTAPSPAQLRAVGRRCREWRPEASPPT